MAGQRLVREEKERREKKAKEDADIDAAKKTHAACIAAAAREWVALFDAVRQKSCTFAHLSKYFAMLMTVASEIDLLWTTAPFFPALPTTQDLLDLADKESETQEREDLRDFLSALSHLVAVVQRQEEISACLRVIPSFFYKSISTLDDGANYDDNSSPNNNSNNKDSNNKDGSMITTGGVVTDIASVEEMKSNLSTLMGAVESVDTLASFSLKELESHFGVSSKFDTVLLKLDSEFLRNVRLASASSFFPVCLCVCWHDGGGVVVAIYWHGKPESGSAGMAARHAGRQRLQQRH